MPSVISFVRLHLDYNSFALFIHSNSPVTIVDYHVTIDQADSSLTIAEEPSLQVFQEKFHEKTSVTVCNCEISSIRNITTQGNFDPNNSSQIEAVAKALADAWKKANQSNFIFFIYTH